jgi:hypothetical protein
MAPVPIGFVFVLVSPDLTHRRVRGEFCLAHGSRFDAFAWFSMHTKAWHGPSLCTSAEEKWRQIEPRATHDDDLTLNTSLDFYSSYER